MWSPKGDKEKVRRGKAGMAARFQEYVWRIERERVWIHDGKKRN